MGCTAENTCGIITKKTLADLAAAGSKTTDANMPMPMAVTWLTKLTMSSLPPGMWGADVK